MAIILDFPKQQSIEKKYQDLIQEILSTINITDKHKKQLKDRLVKICLEYYVEWPSLNITLPDSISQAEQEMILTSFQSSFHTFQNFLHTIHHQYFIDRIKVECELFIATI